MLNRLKRISRQHPLAARVAVVFMTALIVRVMAALVLNSELGTQVTDSYDVIGRNLADGYGFSYQPGRDVPTATRAPFYPVYWSVLQVSGLPTIGFRMVEAFIDSGTAALVSVLAFLLAAGRLGGSAGRLPGRRLGASSPREAVLHNFTLVSGLVYALQPYTVYYTVKLGSETWFSFWLVLVLVSFCVWVKKPSLFRGGALGLALGVLILNKSVAVGLVPMLLVLGLVWRRPSSVASPSWIRSAGLVILVCVGLVAPWLVRNYLVTGGTFVPVQTLTWWNFWYDFDFSADAIGQSVARHYGPAGGMPYSLTAAADAAQEAQLQAEAFDWIRSHPASAAGKVGRNLVEFWYLTEGVTRSRVAMMSSVIQIVLSAAGLSLAWRAGYRRPVLLCLVLIAYFMLAYAAVFAVFRYSLVVVPLLSMAEAVLIVWVLRRRLVSVFR